MQSFRDDYSIKELKDHYNNIKISFTNIYKSLKNSVILQFHKLLIIFQVKKMKLEYKKIFLNLLIIINEL